jgi:hypothetical protein
MGTLRAKLELVNPLFTRHVYTDKVNFLFKHLANIPGSVNVTLAMCRGSVQFKKGF